MVHLNMTWYKSMLNNKEKPQELCNMTCIIQATMKDDRLDSLASADGLPMHTVPSAIL